MHGRKSNGSYRNGWHRIAASISDLLGHPSQSLAGPATEAVKGTIDQVLRVLQDKEMKKPEIESTNGDKSSRRRSVIDSVGRKWPSEPWALNGPNSPISSGKNLSICFGRC